MPKKQPIPDTLLEAHRLESTAQSLHDRVDATHKAAHDMRLRATEARKKAQETAKRAKAQVSKAVAQTDAVHKTEKTGDSAHQKIRKLPKSS